MKDGRVIKIRSGKLINREGVVIKTSFIKSKSKNGEYSYVALYNDDDINMPVLCSIYDIIDIGKSDFSYLETKNKINANYKNLVYYYLN